MATDWSKQTVPQLKEELMSRGLETNGKKADMVKRLVDHDQILEEEARMEQEEEGGAIIAKTNEKTDPETTTPAEDDDNEDDPDVMIVKEEESDVVLVKVDQAPKDANEETTAQEDIVAKDDKEKEAEGDQECKVTTEDNKEKVEDTAEEKGKDEDKVVDSKDDKAKTESKSDKFPAKEMQKHVEGKILYLPWHGGGTVVVPCKDQIRTDLATDSKRHSVLLFPVTIDDLASPVFKTYLARAINFHIVFQHDWQFKEKIEEGHVEFHFRDPAEAEAMASEMEGFKEGINVKHLGAGDERGKLVQKWIGQESKHKDPIGERLLVFAPLPSDTTEEELKALFTDAQRIVVAVDSKGEPKGYGYAEYQSEKQVKEAMEKHTNKTEFRGEKLFVYKCLKDRPVALLATKDFRNAMQTIKQAEMTLNRQGRYMHQMQKRNIIQQKRNAKDLLNKDLETREKMGLPLRLSQIKEKERLEKRDKELEEKKVELEKKKAQRVKERQEREKKREEEKAKRKLEGGEDVDDKAEDDAKVKEEEDDTKEEEEEDADSEEFNIFELMKNESKEDGKTKKKSDSKTEKKSFEKKGSDYQSRSSYGRRDSKNEGFYRERKHSDRERKIPVRTGGFQGGVRQSPGSWGNRGASNVSHSMSSQRTVSMGGTMRGQMMGAQGGMMGAQGGGQTQQALNMLIGGLSNMLQNQVGGQQGFSQQQTMQQQQSYGGGMGWNAANQGNQGNQGNQMAGNWGNKRKSGPMNSNGGANWKRQRRR